MMLTGKDVLLPRGESKPPYPMEKNNILRIFPLYPRNAFYI
jgi:hypothetical protein